MDTHVILLLCGAFFLMSALYASVGFGGGSSYTALLACSGMATTAIPVVSLTCNLVVVSGGVWHFGRHGHLRWSLTWPFLVSPVPAAYIGGRITIAPAFFLLVLGVALLASGAILLLKPRCSDREPLRLRGGVPTALTLGAGLGLLAGMVGIGGGVFLAPLLLLLRWGKPKEIAATAALFILVNSVAGLAGQLSKPVNQESIGLLAPMVLAVLVGGQIGSWAGAGRVPQGLVRGLTAVLVFLVGARLLVESVRLFGQGGIA